MTELTPVPVEHGTSSTDATVSHGRSRSNAATDRSVPIPAEPFETGDPLGVVVLDGELRIEFASEGLEALIGIRPTDCIGRSLHSIIPFVGDTLIHIARRALETGNFDGAVPLAIREPNEPMDVRHWIATIFPIGWNGSRATGVGIALRDITEHARASERQAQNRRRRDALHALTASLLDATTSQEVVRATIDHVASVFDASGTVVAWCTPDRAYLELLDAEGMPAEVATEWRSFPVSAPVPLAYVARTGEPLFLESAQDWKVHFPELASLADGVGHFANAIVPLLNGSESVGALGIAFSRPRHFDDDDRALAKSIGHQCSVALERVRQLEEERTARAAAISASEFKTKFMATLSHELRTPLQAISGYSDLLLMEGQGPLTPGQRDLVVRVQHNLAHLLSIVGGVLSLLRAESGRIEYDITDVSVESVLGFVLEATAPQVAVKNLQLAFEGCRNQFVRADPNKLRQIVLNLFSNAIKFTPAGGSITTRCSNEGRRVRIEVRDTGPGIAADQHEQVFEPFVQLGRPLSSRSEGSGLGLAISREFARAMGGDVTVESEVGAGSSFFLVLPGLVRPSE